MKYFAILGKLVARTAVHVGTHESGDATDTPCRRNANGQYMLPGTAIAGVLRTIATRLAPRFGSPPCRLLWSKEKYNALSEDQKKLPCDCWACHLFGDTNPNEDGPQVNAAEASRLIISHAIADGAETKIRDGVGIERDSGAAARAAGAKFDFEVLPAGSVFQFRIELEHHVENEIQQRNELILAAALAEWQAGRAWIGGSTARGLGAFDLTGIKAVALDFAKPEDLLLYLESDEPWSAATEQSGWFDAQLQKGRNAISGFIDGDWVVLQNVAHSYVNVRFGLKIEGGFLANDTTAAAWSGFSHAPLLEMISRNSKAILPGASLRGVLRAQAEKIARTLATLEEGVVDAESFGAKCPACDPSQRQSEDKLDDRDKETHALESCDHLIQRRLAIEDQDNEEYLCLSCRLFGSTLRGSRLRIEDAEAASSTQRKVLDFLAIDRFTGGGKDGAKFDALALWEPVFNVSIHFENPQAWELGWLALVLRDLADGLLTVGFGAAKGFGRARVDAFQVTYGFITDDDFCGQIDLARASTRPTSGVYRELTWDTSQTEQRNELCNLAEEWVQKFHEVRRAFVRPDELKLTKDTYFTADNLHELYVKEAFAL